MGGIYLELKFRLYELHNIWSTAGFIDVYCLVCVTAADEAGAFQKL